MRYVHQLVALLSLCMASHGLAQEQVVRLATYNIRFLDATKIASQDDRLEKLQDVIKLLDADIIALQEIADTDSLRQVFSNGNEWMLVIDDDSGDTQDVAFAIRRPAVKLVDRPNGPEFDADDDDFLFSSHSSTFFPKRRDVLALKCETLETGHQFWVMNIHAKSRYGGRATTDFRREGAAEALVKVLNKRFDGTPVALLGDYNDNPDDRSLNIMETGDPHAKAGPEHEPGPFLINLTEPLLADGHVSQGLTSAQINHATGRINTIDALSRQRNNAKRGKNSNTGDILFDQILVSPALEAHYIAASTSVFDESVAVKGNNNNRASDHLPVYADFLFVRDLDTDDHGLRLVKVMPDPNGVDRDNEIVWIANNSDAPVDLANWTLADRAGGLVKLTGTVAPRSTLELTLPGLLLNNSGDTISLKDATADLVHQVTYTRQQVRPGVSIRFD